MSVKKKMQWTAARLAELRKRYPDEKSEVLAKDLGCSLPAIYSQARILGLHKSEAFNKSAASGRAMPGRGVGPSGRFPKGHVPANKGLRRPGYAPGRMAETQFGRNGLKGHVTRVPIGTERWRDGFLWRKVTNIHNDRHDWRAVHRLIWEESGNKIPKGHVLVFKNGDRKDIRIENLELITMRDNMKRNTIARYPKELRKVIRLKAAVTRKLNERQSHEEQD